MKFWAWRLASWRESLSGSTTGRAAFAATISAFVAPAPGSGSWAMVQYWSSRSAARPAMSLLPMASTTSRILAWSRVRYSWTRTPFSIV